MRTVLLGLAGVVAAAVLAAPGAGQTHGEKIRISAWAINMSNIGTGQTAPVEFLINRWSTNADREALVATMVGKGQDALLRKLQSMPSHGRMRFPTVTGRDPLRLSLGWDLRFTYEEPLPEGGRRIIMALDRYMSFWEQRNQPRTVDYPFTLVEVRVDRNGEGEGKLSIASKIRFDKEKNVIELENYSSEPLRLQQVKVTPQT